MSQELKRNEQIVLTQERIDNEVYYKISNVDKMRPFFMSILSASNHWLFIGSNGGLSAGRKDAEHALFPYYTDDKIIESAERTGSKTILRIQKEGKAYIWEPFATEYANLYDLQRNLYKSACGNKILFEEINPNLGLTFRYQWSTSERYGFVRSSTLINSTAAEMSLSLLDGIQDIMPSGVGSALQSQRSNLVDAYKRNELDKESGIGIFSLSAIIVDKAEPSEALKANIAYAVGLESPMHLLSATQLGRFRMGLPLHEEKDVKAEKGAYFIHANISLESKGKKEWMIVADVNQSVSQIVDLSKSLRSDRHLGFRVKEDVESGTQELLRLGALADGLQLTADRLKDTRHFFNAMFNLMRGGIFDDHYTIGKSDLSAHLAKANQQVAERHRARFEKLPGHLSLSALKALAQESNDPDLIRQCLEYLPLRFSRRHGDPSRPWNHFSINIRNEHDGSKVLDYAGNWRDIFQNWEALSLSFPEFLDGMIFRFLNASTFDGYNPYRITKDGIDWERIEADDPWSYIGYWGDHQIIYLLKFLELSERYEPAKLDRYFDAAVFVYANVPYKIKRYEDILRNPKDTIEFDHSLDRSIDERRADTGADGALLQNQAGDIHHVNFIEKILATVLAKVSNFIPEGGLWMNTQRPEWNDANNALVGNGVSVVTLCYLRRFLKFLIGMLERSSMREVRISEELAIFYESCYKTLHEFEHVLNGSISNQYRKSIMDGLGTAGSNYRWRIYAHSFSNQRRVLQIADLVEFSALCIRYLEHTIRANKRSDQLYHAYNLMTVENDLEVSIAHLSEMLEGQVAVLSSGYLTAKEALDTLDGLKTSSLFRADQQSYLLYPNKELPGFLKKNNVPATDVRKSAWLTNLLNEGNRKIIEQDINGGFHFNGSFRNVADLQKALEELEGNGIPVTAADKEEVLRLFEKVFHHKAFTGRSGTFFGYEGLGSIYWHMVSKLQVAVQECCLKAIEENESEALVQRLIGHYDEINEGIGVHKSPMRYGAFPTDPYSHTPANKGAQQPGMTGQVKEDLLCRFGELGVRVIEGQLHLDPHMLRRAEFLSKKQVFTYVNLQGKSTELPLEGDSLCFTYCQVPVVCQLGNENYLEVILADGVVVRREQLALDPAMSKKVFGRTGEVVRIIAHINRAILR